MANFDDRTFGMLRAQSERKAGRNQGAIVARGGIYAGRNLECEEETSTGELIVRGLSKMGGDLSVGGIVYCPDMYTINEDVIKIKRNLVPGCLKNPTKPNELAGLGTKKDPWPIICADTIKSNNLCSKHILAGSIKTKTIDIDCLPKLSVGTNACGQPLFDVEPNGVSINSGLNIVNPETNEITIEVSSESAETFIPIYQQWNSFQSTIVDYCPGQILYIYTSYNFINTGNYDELALEYDGGKVPNNTKVYFYFLDGTQLTRAKYVLEITRCKKKFIFKSKKFVKKIKLIFTENHIYLL